MKRVALLALLLSSTAALAQQGDPINQSGLVTPGHPIMWITNNVAGDGGTAAQGLLTGLGVTASGPSICANSGPVTGAYNQICMGATSSGATLQINNFNGASGALNLAGNIALTALAGQIQCLQVNISGVITGTGQPCGGSGGGGQIGGLNGQLQFNNNGVFGGISTTSTNGSTLFIQSGGFALSGASSGNVFLNPQTVASGSMVVPNGNDTLAGISLIQTLSNKTLSSPVFTGTSTGSATFNGTYIFNGSNNFASNALLSNGVQISFPPSGNLVGVADTQVLLNKSINGSEINSGTVPATSLPVATSAAQGIVQGDGSTMTIAGGTISCTTATAAQIGCSKPDNTTITASAGVLTAVAPAAASVTVGVTLVGSSSNGFVLYNNAGVLGNLNTTGSGNVVQATSPTLSGTIGGNLTFSGNLIASGLLSSGAISGSLCTTGTGAIINVASQGCFGVGVLSLNSLAGNLTLAVGTQAAVTSSGTTVTVFPVIRSYLAGLTLSNDGGSPLTVLDTAVGVATDSTNAVMINLGSAFTKSTSGSWAAGSGSAGMSTANSGAVQPSTWYHVCLANNGGTADEWFDPSPICANRPPGITDVKYRRIGSFLTNSSSQILAFTQFGNEFLWKTIPGDVPSTNTSTVAALKTLSVPSGVNVIAKINSVLGTLVSATGCIIYQPDIGTQAVIGSSAIQVLDMYIQPGGLAVSESNLTIRTNTSSQVGVVCSASATATYWINTRGWIDARGENN